MDLVFNRIFNLATKYSPVATATLPHNLPSLTQARHYSTILPMPVNAREHRINTPLVVKNIENQRASIKNNPPLDRIPPGTYPHIPNHSSSSSTERGVKRYR